MPNLMKKTELLAPAKDKNAAICAVNAGCDAIYIGANLFGARKAASNSIEDIKEIVNYAHKFYVKVHVTINTILSDEELLKAKKLIQELYDIGVDAIIVQDMGILQLAIEGKIPPIEIHASTQCDNRTLEKVKFFDNIGIPRVILARELSLNQINEICKNTNCQIETFVHGALCVSYSGQCYLSYCIGGRSANKGECAQPCRKKYSLVTENGRIIAENKHLLSLKDLNASEHLESLVNMGVDSFKIEGRLKDENYIKNVVFYYRQKLDKISAKTSSGKIFSNFNPNIDKTFNRKYTDYFLTGRSNCYNFDTPKFSGEYVGTVKKVLPNCLIMNSDTILNNQDGLCFFNDGELLGFSVNKVEGNKIFPSKMPQIKSGCKIFRNLDKNFNKTLANAEFSRKIKVDFFIDKNSIKVIDEDENEITIIFLENKSPLNAEKLIENFKNQLKKTGNSDFYVEKIEILQTPPFMPISKINEYRRIIFEKLMAKRFNNYKRNVQKSLNYKQFPIEKIDYRGNIHNSKAKLFYENCGCKVLEMSMESTKHVKNRELMRTKHCLKFAHNMCKSPEKLYLIDDSGARYSLDFDCLNCEMIVTK